MPLFTFERRLTALVVLLPTLFLGLGVQRAGAPSTWPTRNHRIHPDIPRPQAPVEPRLELVELAWRMRGLQKATRILDYGIYRTNIGLEARTGCVNFGPLAFLYDCIDDVKHAGETDAE